MSLTKHELRKISNQKHKHPLNANLHDALTEYKKLLYEEKNDHYISKITELEQTAEKGPTINAFGNV